MTFEFLKKSLWIFSHNGFQVVGFVRLVLGADIVYGVADANPGQRGFWTHWVKILWPATVPIERPFSCFVIVIECPRIGRTRLVGGKIFLKIKYGVTTLQKRAIFHNLCPPNMVYKRPVISFKVSTNIVLYADATDELLTSGQRLLGWGVTNIGEASAVDSSENDFTV